MKMLTVKYREEEKEDGFISEAHVMPHSGQRSLAEESIRAIRRMPSATVPEGAYSFVFLTDCFSYSCVYVRSSKYYVLS
jgi:hypothetical protein